MQVLSVSDLSPRFYLLCVYSMQKKVFLQWIKVGGMSENQTQGRSLSDMKRIEVCYTNVGKYKVYYERGKIE